MTTGVYVPTKGQNNLNSFVVTMWVEQCGDVFVRSCEIIGDQFRNRTSFGDRPRLENTFSERMAREIGICVRKLSMQTEVLALPSLQIQLPGLSLSGARLVATRLTNGTVNVILRFKSFFGKINAAFRNNLGFDTRLDHVNSVLATKVLDDIALPLLNICTALDQDPAADPSSRMAKITRHLSAHSHEIRFQVELLKRFVTQQAQSAEEQRHVPPTQSPLRLSRAQMINNTAC
jgi:hypothetical protein